MREKYKKRLFIVEERIKELERKYNTPKIKYVHQRLNVLEGYIHQVKKLLEELKEKNKSDE